MTPLTALILLLCSAGALCALAQDSNNFIDTVLTNRLPYEVGKRNLDPAQGANFQVKFFRRIFRFRQDFKAKFTFGNFYGLSKVKRRGDCSAPAWEATNTTFGCHLSLDRVQVSYKVEAKGGEILGSSNFSVYMFVHNTNFFVQVTSAQSVPATLNTISLNSLELKISESTKLGLNKGRSKKYHDAIRTRVQEQLAALLYGSFRDALNNALATVTAPFP
ncbi:salivary anticoagulant protein P23-like isoform X2 [Dermacentor albipictus]|uniref:salivary anticoagulant protein P23-like isoform X2 n=1 Tax=Dermacentor albipictus TaxID=60249 RepID=UPI0031FCC8B5